MKLDGNKVREYRKMAGISQTGLAKILGKKSKSEVSYWELGSRDVPIHLNEKIAAALGVPVTALSAHPVLCDNCQAVIDRKERASVLMGELLLLSDVVDPGKKGEFVSSWCFDKKGVFK